MVLFSFVEINSYTEPYNINTKFWDSALKFQWLIVVLENWLRGDFIVGQQRTRTAEWLFKKNKYINRQQTMLGVYVNKVGKNKWRHTLQSIEPIGTCIVQEYVWN